MKKLVDHCLVLIVGAWLGLLQYCSRNASHDTFSMVLISGFLLLCFLSDWSKPKGDQ